MSELYCSQLPTESKVFLVSSKSKKHDQYIRDSFQRVLTHKSWGQLQEWLVPSGTHSNTHLISRWNLKCSNIQSEVMQITVPYTSDPLLSACRKAMRAWLPPASWRATSQPAHHQFFPSTKVIGIDICPPIQLKQNPKRAPFPFFWLEILLCSNSWVTIWLQCCTRELQFLLLTDWESSPLPAQICSDISGSLYNSFNSHRQL